MKCETPTEYWYLWLGNGGNGKMLAYGPLDTKEAVDSMERPIRDYCEKTYSNYSYFWESGGVSFSEDKGPGKLNHAIQWGAI